jgi:hypothetical protein
MTRKFPKADLEAQKRVIGDPMIEDRLTIDVEIMRRVFGYRVDPVRKVHEVVMVRDANDREVVLKRCTVSDDLTLKALTAFLGADPSVSVTLSIGEDGERSVSVSGPKGSMRVGALSFPVAICVGIIRYLDL